MTSERGVERPARVGAIGAAITAFAFLDAYTGGLLIAALPAWLPALIVFAVAAVVLTLINGAWCRCVERQWDAGSPATPSLGDIAEDKSNQPDSTVAF